MTEVPLNEPDAEVLNVDVMLREHLADLSSCHARHGIAVDDDLLLRRECLERRDNTVTFIVCGMIRVTVCLAD